MTNPLTRSHRRTLTRLGAALALALAVAPAPAAAQTALPLGSWTEFFWSAVPGPIDDPAGGFTFTLAAPGRLRLVDAFAVGEVFDLFVNGALRLTTSTPADDVLGTETDATDGDAAWADARLGRGELALDAGTYAVTVGVRAGAPGYDYGSAFLRADLAGGAPPPVVTTTPEPASVALLGAGLAAVAATAARRRRGVA
jgi:hypothetical protein